MKIYQIIKKLNNTELGKTGTHETYVQVPTELDVSSIFQEEEKYVPFLDKTSKMEYGKKNNIRLTVGREHRICGLGDYYRDKGLNAGDEIIFEKRVSNDTIEYFIDCHKLSNTVVLRKDSKGYELLTPETALLLDEEVFEKRSGMRLSLVFSQAVKKRIDSKEETKYYRLMLDDQDYSSPFSGKDLLEIEIINSSATIFSDFIWKTYSFEQEEI